MDSSQFEGADSKPTGAEPKTFSVSVKSQQIKISRFGRPFWLFCVFTKTLRVSRLIPTEFGISTLKLTRIHQKSVYAPKMTEICTLI